jgi:hypothetical protein
MRRSKSFNDEHENYRKETRHDNPDDTENIPARNYEGADEYVDMQENNNMATRGRALSRRESIRLRRQNRNYRNRTGNRMQDAWDRFSNHEQQTYSSEHERDRLEREYGEGSRFGFGYSRYPKLDYGDYSSGPDDDFEYYEDLRHRAYDDTRYGREGGYSDVWRGERNQEWIRRPARRRRAQEHHED